MSTTPDSDLPMVRVARARYDRRMYLQRQMMRGASVSGIVTAYALAGRIAMVVTIVAGMACQWALERWQKRRDA